MFYDFFVLILVSQSILAMSENEFDKLLMQNYHSRKNNSGKNNHVAFATGDAFQNLSLVLLKLAENGNKKPWTLPKIGRK